MQQKGKEKLDSMSLENFVQLSECCHGIWSAEVYTLMNMSQIVFPLQIVEMFLKSHAPHIQSDSVLLSYHSFLSHFSDK